MMTFIFGKDEAHGIALKASFRRLQENTPCDYCSRHALPAEIYSPKEKNILNELKLYVNRILFNSAQGLVISVGTIRSEVQKDEILVKIINCFWRFWFKSHIPNSGTNYLLLMVFCYVAVVLFFLLHHVRKL